MSRCFIELLVLGRVDSHWGNLRIGKNAQIRVSSLLVKVVEINLCLESIQVDFSILQRFVRLYIIAELYEIHLNVILLQELIYLLPLFMIGTVHADLINSFFSAICLFGLLSGLGSLLTSFFRALL